MTGYDWCVRDLMIATLGAAALIVTGLMAPSPSFTPEDVGHVALPAWPALPARAGADALSSAWTSPLLNPGRRPDSPAGPVTEAPPPESPPSETIRLVGIVESGAAAAALFRVDGSALVAQVGASLAGWRVVAIRGDRVDLASGDRRLSLSMADAEPAAPPRTGSIGGDMR